VRRRTDPQLALSFARPRPGGLELGDYRELVERLRRDARRVAERFGLPPFDLDADRPDSHDRYGICFDDGRIRVRLVHARTGRPLKYSALVDTVVHELAHLRYMNHGQRWEALYQRMLLWCRNNGVYQPRRTEPAARPEPADLLVAPEQLALFGRGSSCATRRASGCVGDGQRHEVSPIESTPPGQVPAHGHLTTGWDDP
jgi:hypothetical protein